MIVCHDVCIKRKLNGWLVQVGCREFVFSLSQEAAFYELLKMYFRAPLLAIEMAKAYEYDQVVNNHEGRFEVQDSAIGVEPRPRAMERIPEPAGTCEQSRREI